MKKSPCFGCTERSAKCALQNNDCERYRNWKAEHDAAKACMNVFGESYRLMDLFNCRRRKCLPEYMQLTLTGEGSEQE